MRFKYKKLVFLFTLGIMLIGFCVFSMVSPDIHISLPVFSSQSVTRSVTFGAITTVSGKSKSSTEQEIQTLVSSYLDAKQRVDMKALKKLVSNIKYMEYKKLLAESQYVEQYQDIQCKILNGARKGDYRVYVCSKIKIYDIETPVPSLTALYIRNTAANHFQIYLGPLQAKDQSVINKLDDSSQVKELAAQVQKEMKTVISQDQELHDFYEMLDSAKNESSSKEDNQNIDQEANPTSTP